MNNAEFPKSGTGVAGSAPARSRETVRNRGSSWADGGPGSGSNEGVRHVAVPGCGGLTVLGARATMTPTSSQTRPEGHSP